MKVWYLYTPPSYLYTPLTYYLLFVMDSKICAPRIKTYTDSAHHFNILGNIQWNRHWSALPKDWGLIPKKFVMLRDNGVGSTQADIQATSTLNLLEYYC